MFCLHHYESLIIRGKQAAKWNYPISISNAWQNTRKSSENMELPGIQGKMGKIKKNHATGVNYKYTML